MKLTFVESFDFTTVAHEYFGTDTEFAVFQESLLTDPDRGDVMPACGGLRKVRWRDLRRGKGKRGGLRIIYLHVPEAKRVLLLDVYDKDENQDLTRDEKRALASVAQEYRIQVLKGTERKKS